MEARWRLDSRDGRLHVHHGAGNEDVIYYELNLMMRSQSVSSSIRRW
jgi:hypothetical protein